MNTRKIKILKSYKEYDGYRDDYETYTYGVTEWDEVTQEEFIEIKKAVTDANQYDSPYTYFIVEQATKKELLDKAAKFVQQIKEKNAEKQKQLLELAEKKAAAAREREAKALDRKKKQLAKLQCEIHELTKK